MSEKWVTLLVEEDETVRCTSCLKYLHGQKIYLYLDVDGELNDAKCRYCWAKYQMHGDNK
jgi:uncharacterized Zn-finger protein